MQALILARFPSQRKFAQQIDMDPTYLNRIIKGSVQRPDPETIAKMADALGYDSDELMVLAGYPARGVPDSAPAPMRLPMESGDEQFDVGQIVAYIEARPGDVFKRRLARQKLLRTPEAYVRLCVRLFRAWASNSDLAMDAVEMVEQ